MLRIRTRICFHVGHEGKSSVFVVFVFVFVVVVVAVVVVVVVFSSHMVGNSQQTITRHHRLIRQHRHSFTVSPQPPPHEQKRSSPTPPTRVTKTGTMVLHSCITAQAHINHRN